MGDRDTDVLIIGSGFGASVAALRFAEINKKVTVLEKGGWISRENFEADASMFWHPKSGKYGMNELKKRGRHIIPWLGVGVGGGSHVYAGTLKRRDFFDDFPVDVSVSEMATYYKKGEQMLEAMKYPDYPPYNDLPSYCIFRQAEKQLAKERPDIVESHGDILLGISYAPENGTPGAKFVNKFGAEQLYSNPDEQKILGGEIDVKNTLDKNYLFEAQKHGAEIHDFKEVYKIEQLSDGGYLVHWKNPKKDSEENGKVSCDILICGAGSIGSTELLLKNKYLYKTLPNISDTLGKNYHVNGDNVTFLIPKKGLLISWIGLIGTIVALFLSFYQIAIIFGLIYLVGWILSAKKSEPDKGTTNSDYIRFKHRDGSTQGAYIEGGRYPTPIKAFAAIVLSLTGNFRPQSYKSISKAVNWMGKFVPVFELIERSWPIPILMMGRDDAKGSFYLNKEGEAEIDFDIKANNDYISYLNELGRIFSKRAKSYFIPNGVAKLFKIIEVPHNIGGATMGKSIKEGVVDSYGRVFGYENFIIMDGSILPTSLGPNPVSTIIAFSERGLEKAIDQLRYEHRISSIEEI